MDTFNTHILQALCLIVTFGICLSRTGASIQREDDVIGPAEEEYAENGIKALRPQFVEREQEEEFKIDKERVVMCSEDKCGQLRLEDIKQAYPHSFSSQKYAEDITGLNYYTYVEKFPEACKSCQQRFWNDYDRSCPTWRYVTFYDGSLRDITNRWCYIIQIPFLHLYQYISVGLCGPRYRCRKCVQQYTIQSLLAWCPGSFGIQMRHFRIPTYCSCQSSIMCMQNWNLAKRNYRMTLIHT